MVCYTESVVLNYAVLCLWIIVGYTAPVAVNLLCMTHTHWLSIAHHDSQPLAQHYTPWLTITCSALHTMIHNHWFSLTHHNSQPLNQYIAQWFTATIMLCYAEPVVVNHCVLCWGSGYELWWVMLRQWLWIMVCNAEPVVLNHGVLYWANNWHSITNSQPLAQYNQLLFTSIAQHNSKPLTQYSTPWSVVVNHGV
jgi:hypothetical protein